MTKYTEFTAEGSNVDYELCCLVDVNNDFEGALKINFRPNLYVVAQMGMVSPSEDGLRHIRFYLQTLQMRLQENNE
jgi:hypothetical protein